MTNTPLLNNFLGDVGHSVHCMNTIAVSLSHLSDKTEAPEELNITWESGDVKKSSINARRFAIKSSIVYSVESFFEYLTNVSKDPFWKDSGITFIPPSKKGQPTPSKAEKVVSFLTDIPDLEREWIILAELSCHWRNRIIHASNSNANISQASERFLINKKNQIYENNCHFDVEIALDNFAKNKFTLKDATTLITIIIKCVNTIDKHFIQLANALSTDEIMNRITSHKEFRTLENQEESSKRTRQIKKWIKLNYGFINAKKITVANICPESL